jgi:penicillin-binding protein 1C
MKRRKVLIVLAAVVVAYVAEPMLISFVPLPASLFGPHADAIQILDRNGETLRTARNGDRPFEQYAALSEIPQALVAATVAAEDGRFREHHGVDWRADARAAWQMVWNRRVVSGASTITQQLIKLSSPRPRTMAAKLVESLQALRLEQVWDKQRILTE